MTRSRTAAVVAVLGAAVLPLFLAPAGDVMGNLVLAAAYVGMALGLNVIVGFAGLLDLGYVAFFAIGAYTAGYFGSGYWHETGFSFLVEDPVAGLPGIHLNFVLVFVLAIAATAVAGVIIGVPTLRLRGDYIAIVTLAFGEIVSSIVSNGDQIRVFGGTLTAGGKGITPIDKIDLPFLAPFEALNLRPWYWCALALVLLTLVVNLRLRDSRLGRAWLALREDEEAAASAGIPLTRTKLLAYGTGAGLGGLFGAFLASFLNTVTAVQFEFSFSIFVLAMVVVGGLGSIWGVVGGAVVLSALNSYVLPDLLGRLPGRLGFDFDLSQVSYGIYGALLVIMVLLRPAGLWPERR